MKITIRNLGVVRAAEIDFKPLTIFVGPNNAGKTWTAYAVAGIFGRHGLGKYTETYINDEVTVKYPLLDTAIQEVLDNGHATLDVVQFARENLEEYINYVAQFASQWMGNFLSTDKIVFELMEVQVLLENSKNQILEHVKDSSLQRRGSVGQQGGEPIINAWKESGNPTLFFYADDDVEGKLPELEVKRFLVRRAFQILHRAFYPDTVPLPTERTTFITWPYSARRRGSAEPLTSAESSQQQRRGKPFILPIGYFLDMLVDVMQSSETRRRLRSSNKGPSQVYSNLASLLETDILQGGVGLSTPRPTPDRELVYRPTKDVTMEMPIVSSMVKELSPLVLYLRYLVEKGDLLVIDEPEMNLHPEAQVKMMEFLAMLVNAGLNVLFTTHSPYMVDHLVNLMKANKHEDKEGIKDKFYLQSTAAFIPQDQVSVYLFGDGTAKSVLCEDGTIDWGTFADVSDRINQIYYELS